MQQLEFTLRQCLVLLLVVGACSGGLERCVAESLGSESSTAAAFRKYCWDCHGRADGEAVEVGLWSVSDQQLKTEPAMLRRIIDAIGLNEMPPEGAPSLGKEERVNMLRWLQTQLHDVVSAEGGFAATPIRRMNRFQYNNAVVDLFQLKCTVFTLPEKIVRDHNNYFRPETGKMPDVVLVGSRPLGKSQMIEPRLAGVAAFPQDLRAEHGFDNRADHLSLSPLLMEAFLELGVSITESPDFDAENVGTWEKWFATPDPEDDRKLEMHNRIEAMLRLAFRQIPAKQTTARYSAYAGKLLENGTDCPTTMKRVASAIIASPRFLYLYGGSFAEREKEDDYDLATRLSFFLWGSIPDEELLTYAASGSLRDRRILEVQVDRMLADRRLKRFCDSFPSQWLQLDRIISSVPNRDKFPKFYFAKYRDSMHMMLEPLLLFEAVLVENRPIIELIDSDFTYRSYLLEEAYEELGHLPVERKSGDTVGRLRFRRVPVTDRRNGGVITNAAVMTMTSGPEETKPMTRGAWLATVIFNKPPDPPPGDVPPLDAKGSAGEEGLTLRERFAAHRKRADCRGCHERIDPLGFALENYNPVGVWRDEYENGRGVDVSGVLFQRQEFATVEEFKDAILAEKDQFTHALASHLLSFALAREIDARDLFSLEQIVATTAADGYRMQRLLRQIILSDPFLSR